MNLTTDEITAIKESTVHDYIKKRQQAFVEYVIDTAETVVEVDEAGIDALRDVHHELSNAGFPPVHEERDGTHVEVTPMATWVLAPNVFLAVRDECEVTARLDPPTFGNPALHIEGIRIFQDPTLPDDTGLCVQHEAIFPTPPQVHERPWDIRAPEGIGLLRVEGL